MQSETFNPNTAFAQIYGTSKIYNYLFIAMEMSVCSKRCRDNNIILPPHLRPGSSFPLCRAEDPVTWPAALRAIATTVLEMNRTVCTIMKRLNTAHSTDLVTRTPAGLCTVFPIFCYPAAWFKYEIVILWLVCSSTALSSNKLNDYKFRLK